MTPRVFVFIAATLLLSSLSLHAAPSYRVEIILVAYQTEQLIGDEQWPDALAHPQADSKATDLNWWQSPSYTQYNALMAGFGFPRMPAANWDAPLQPLSDLQLKAEANRIQQEKGMKVIWHKAWIEPVQEQEQAIVHPLDIRLSDDLDIQLSGYLSLHRNRFLHLSTNLVIEHFQRKTAQMPMELPQQSQDLNNDYRSDLLTQAGIENSLNSTPQLVPVRAAHIRQSRRMRSGELHYIDHPMLGIVVRVVPVGEAAGL